MQNRKLIFRNKFIEFLCFIFAFSLFTALWKFQVNAIPQSTNSTSFYLSFVNYLSASEAFFNDFVLFSKIAIKDHSPLGSLWPAWFISVFGVQSVFLWEPYLAVLFVLIPIALVPFFFKLTPPVSWLFALSLFYFPPTQIIVKTFCAESYAIVYCLLGFLCFRSYLSTKQNMHLLWSVIALWLAVISNFIGIIVTLIIFQSYLFFAFNQRKYDFKIFTGVLIIIFFGIPFYHEHIFEDLSWTMFNFRSKLLYIAILTLPLLVGLLSFVQASSSPKKCLSKIFTNFIALSLTVGLLVLKITRSPESISSIDLATLILIIKLIGLISLQFYCDLGKLRSFNYIFIVVCILTSAILSEILAGEHFQLLLLPMIVMFIQSFIESGYSARIVMFIVCFLGSNFFPNSQHLQTLFGNRGLLFSLHGLQSLHSNILSWEKSEITPIKTKIDSKLESVKITGVGKLFAMDNLHFQTRLILSPKQNFRSPMPELKRLDILPKQDLKKLLNEYNQRGDDLFEDWIQSSKFPFIIKGIKPWEVQHTPAAELATLIRNPTRDSEIGMSLSHAFVNYLEKSGALKEKYEPIRIPATNPRVCLYLLKNLEVVSDMPYRMNKALSRVSHHFHIDLYSEAEPWWLENIHPEIKAQIIKRESIRIHKLSQEYRNQANYIQAYKYLIKAKQLDSNNPQFMTNLIDLKKKIPKSMLKLLDQ